MFLAYSDPEGLARFPWLNSCVLPATVQLFDWSELTAAERQRLLQRKQTENGLPDIVDPFKDEEAIEWTTSVGLRRGGEVCGWQINHRIAFDVHRFTTTWTDPDLRGTAAVAMMAESARRYIRTGIPRATIGVFAANLPVARFFDKRIRPHVAAVHETCERSKELSRVNAALAPGGHEVPGAAPAGVSA
jgi:hypothetical protein